LEEVELNQRREKPLYLPGQRRPDFFIVGAAKAGTSSLYNYLVQHPDIFMSDVKEPHYFYGEVSPDTPMRREKTLGHYLKLFEGVPDDVRAGEASTSYLYAANAPREIKQLQEDAKIIMVLRNPVDRAYSQYWNQVRDGVEPLSFEDALKAEPERKRKNWWHGFLYVETGRYAEQVHRYLDVFGRDRLQIHLFEDLSQDAAEVCRKTFSFLEVDPAQLIDTERSYNRSGQVRSRLLAALLGAESIKEPVKQALPAAWRRDLGDTLRELNLKPAPKMNRNTRRQLQDTLREDILRLEDLIGRDLSGWREG
jgi:Sulfotransferase domain